MRTRNLGMGWYGSKLHVNTYRIRLKSVVAQTTSNVDPSSFGWWFRTVSLILGWISQPSQGMSGWANVSASECAEHHDRFRRKDVPICSQCCYMVAPTALSCQMVCLLVAAVCCMSRRHDTSSTGLKLQV